MNRLEYELVTLKNEKNYFVLESLMHEYNVYNLVLNVEDEDDVKIVLQEEKDDKIIFTDVNDADLLKELAPNFIARIKDKQNSNK